MAKDIIIGGGIKMENVDECKSRILESVKNFPAHKLKKFMSYWDWDPNDDCDKWKEVKGHDLESHIREYIKTLSLEDLQALEKFISSRLDNLKKHLLSKAIERIKNLPYQTLEKFISESSPGLKNFFDGEKNVGSDVKSKLESYIKSLSNNAFALEKFLSDLSEFVKIVTIREFDKKYKNFSSTEVKEAAVEFENHKFEASKYIGLTLHEISPKITDILKKCEDELRDNFGVGIKNDSKLDIKVFCENIFKWEGRGFKLHLDNVLKATLGNVNRVYNTYFKKFEDQNYYFDGCYKSDWLCSAKLLYCLNKVVGIKNKRREFLSKLDLDAFSPDKKYGELQIDNINLNADETEKKKTCLRWKEIYIIKYVSQIKNILFNKNLSDTEKLNKINGLTKNITWDEFKKISVVSPGKFYNFDCFENKGEQAQVPAYLFLYEFFWIYKSEFWSQIDADKNMKKMFDDQKIRNLIGCAVDAPKLTRVLSFICYLMLTVISLGLFAIDNEVRDGLKSLSKSSFQSATLKDLMNRFKTLSEELKKKPLSKLNNLQEKKFKKEETRG